MKPVTKLTISEAALNRFFAEARTRLPAAEAMSEINPEQIDRFFAEAKRKVDAAELVDRKLASGFNVFDLICPDENRLSDVLKLLLDPRGGHGQGDLFLRLFLERIHAPQNAKHTKKATVRRESITNRIDNSQRRIDLLVDATVLLVGIENKVNASEQPEQVKDYLEHLRRWAEARSCRSVLIYLTPDCRPPNSLRSEETRKAIANKLLICWDYNEDLRGWLEACRDQCEAPRFNDFLSDFLQYIDQELVREQDNDQDLSAYES